MTKRFRVSDLEQQYLLPPSLQEWLPEDHLARFIGDICNQLDLTPFLARFEGKDGRGKAAYHPVLLLRILIYGYAIGKRSSRQMERATREDVAFRYLSVNQHPDHATIAQFRKTHLDDLANLFTQVLLLCREMGMVKLGTVAIDGTKMLANASKKKTTNYNQLSQAEARLKEKVDAMLAEAAQADAEDDASEQRNGAERDLPGELAKASGRLEKIRKAKKDLEERAKEKARQAITERAASGGKHRNQVVKKQYQRATGAMEKSNPQHNATDPDSRMLMEPMSGGYVQAYNAQAAVDSEAQIILAVAVTNDTNDKRQLEAMAERTVQAVQSKPEVVVADAGYFAVEPIENLEARGWRMIVSPDGGRSKASAETRPKSAISDEMRRRIQDAEEGKRYALRQHTVEPVFGQIKEARGIRRFLLRGLRAVEGEWSLICATNNLLNLWWKVKVGSGLPAMA